MLQWAKQTDFRWWKIIFSSHLQHFHTKNIAFCYISIPLPQWQRKVKCLFEKMSPILRWQMIWFNKMCFTYLFTSVSTNKTKNKHFTNDKKNDDFVVRMNQWIYLWFWQICLFLSWECINYKMTSKLTAEKFFSKEKRQKIVTSFCFWRWNRKKCHTDWTKQKKRRKEKKTRRTTKNKVVRRSCSKWTNIYDYDACNTEGSVEENQTVERNALRLWIRALNYTSCVLMS